MPKNAYPYRFTAKRKVALKRAQAISARKRRGLSRNKVMGAVAGTAIAGGLTAVVVSRKNSTGSWKKAFNPLHKENVRQSNAVSPPWAHPPGSGAPRVARPVKPGDAQAEKELLKALAEEGRRAAGIPANKLGVNRINRPRWGDPSAIDPEVAKEGILRQVDAGEGETTYSQYIDKTIPRKLLKGQQIGERTARRAIAQHRNAVFGKKYEDDLLPRDKGIIKPNEGANSADATLEMMIARGEVKRNRVRKKKAQPTKKKKKG